MCFTTIPLLEHTLGECALLKKIVGAHQYSLFVSF